MSSRHCIFVVLAFAFISHISAQTPEPEAAKAASTITSQQLVALRNAHTLFVSNAGTDSNFTGDQPAGANGPYNEIYALLSGWGRFQLADSPAKADLVLEVHAAEREDYDGETDTDKHGHSYISGANSHAITLDITLRSRPDNAMLWTTEVPCTWGSNKKSSIKYFTACSDKIVQAFQELTSAADATAVPAISHAALPLPHSNPDALAAPAPIPAALRSFSKVFLAPTIADDDGVADLQDDLKIRLQADLANCCGFTIVSDPSQADIVAALHGYTEIYRNTVDDYTTYPQASEFDLDLFDPSTHVLLWSLNSMQSPISIERVLHANTDEELTQKGVDNLVVPLKQFGIPDPTIETTMGLRISNPKKPLPVNSQAAAARSALQASHVVYLNYDDPSVGTNPAVMPGVTGYAFQYLTSAMKTWGHFTLTQNKQEADLILNLETVDLTEETSSKPIVFQRLSVVDTKTQKSLWTIAMNADPGRGPFNNGLAMASVDNCVSVLKILVGQELTGDEKKKLTIPPPPMPILPPGVNVLGLLL